MEFTKQVKFTKEDVDILEEVDEKLKEISCENIICQNCPFFIHTTEELNFKCVLNIIHHIATYALSDDNE